MRLGWSWRLGQLAGIPLRVHWSFALLPAWAVLRERAGGPAWWLGAAYSLLLILALFACVTLHELGHCLVARRRGLAVRDITLFPIGGVARMALWPGRVRPLDEIWVALAGPAVNVALALVLLPLVVVVSGAAGTGLPALPRELGRLSPAGFVTSLWLSNIVLALFNLLPIFPMDGGRVVRALLALGGDYGQATWLAVLLAHGLAIGLVGFGLWTASLLPIALSLVLVVGAGRELAQARRAAPRPGDRTKGVDRA